MAGPTWDLAHPSAPVSRDSVSDRAVEAGAVFVEWRPVHDGVAGSAVPACVAAAAVTEAGDVTDEDLLRAEGVPVGASAGRSGDPLPARGLN